MSPSGSGTNLAESWTQRTQIKSEPADLSLRAARCRRPARTRNRPASRVRSANPKPQSVGAHIPLVVHGRQFSYDVADSHGARQLVSETFVSSDVRHGNQARQFLVQKRLSTPLHQNHANKEMKPAMVRLELHRLPCRRAMRKLPRGCYPSILVRFEAIHALDHERRNQRNKGNAKQRRGDGAVHQDERVAEADL